MLSNTVKGILTTIGCILIHITLGTMYTIGNINQYLVSYIFHKTGQVFLFAMLVSLSLGCRCFID